jgi:hypothetical protein
MLLRANSQTFWVGPRILYIQQSSPNVVLLICLCEAIVRGRQATDFNTRGLMQFSRYITKVTDTNTHNNSQCCFTQQVRLRERALNFKRQNAICFIQGIRRTAL